MREIKKIYGDSSGITFELDDTQIYGMSEFRAKSGKIDGYILYSDTLKYENGIYLSLQDKIKLKQLYMQYIQFNSYDDFVDWDI